MPYNGSGTFSKYYTWVDDEALGTPISPNKWDRQENDFRDGLSSAVTKDGQTAYIANQPMATYKFTGVDNPASRDDYASAAGVQDGSISWCGTTGGDGDDLTATAPITPTSYTVGMSVLIMTHTDVNALASLDVDSVGEKNITYKYSNGVLDKIIDGVLLSGQVDRLVYDGSAFQGRTTQTFPGVDWTARTSGLTSSVFGIAYGGGVYVAVSLDTSDNLASSSNGTSWTDRSIGFSSAAYDVAHDGSGLFVAVGGGGNLSTSTNGTSWTSRSSGLTGAIKSVAYGGGKWVALADGEFSTSTNGTSWTKGSGSLGTFGQKVRYGGGQFVAITFQSGAKFYTSSNGTSWTERTSHPFTGSESADALAYGNGVWVVTGDNGVVATSTDGITWTERDAGFGSSGIGAVVFGGGAFVAAGGNSKIATSTDGITWTQRTASSTSTWESAGYGNGLFLVGGSSAKIDTST